MLRRLTLTLVFIALIVPVALYALLVVGSRDAVEYYYGP